MVAIFGRLAQPFKVTVSGLEHIQWVASQILTTVRPLVVPLGTNSV